MAVRGHKLVGQKATFVLLAFVAAWMATSCSARPASDPDTIPPSASSLSEACGHLKAREVDKELVSEANSPKAEALMAEREAGRISTTDWENAVDPLFQEIEDTSQRYLAAHVGVLKALGYSDWMMYSRYHYDGVGDLWESNVQKGENVGDNKSHPDYKYTPMSSWTYKTSYICNSLR